MKRPTLHPETHATARRALVAMLALYGIACLRTPEVFRIPDAINLAIHETGHLVFLPFGEFMHFLGGTLFQLLFPLLFVAHFARRGDRFAAYVTCWWIAQNLWNVSVYVADARAQLLPLVGGGEHDWEYILGTLGLLHLDQRISRTFHVAGVLVFAWAMSMAWFEAAVTRSPRLAAEALPGPASWFQGTLARRAPINFPPVDRCATLQEAATPARDARTDSLIR